MKEQKKSSSAFGDLWVEDIRKLYPKLAKLARVRAINAASFQNWMAEARVGDLWVIRKGGNWTRVKGFMCARNLAPCRILMPTGYCFNDNPKDGEIQLALDVIRSTGTRCGQFSATYSFGLWQEEGKTFKALASMPLVLNFEETVLLVDYLYWIRRATVRESLLQQFRDNARPECLTFESERKNARVCLHVDYPDDNHALIDCRDLIAAPNCPGACKYFHYSVWRNPDLLARLADMAQEEDPRCGWRYLATGRREEDGPEEAWQSKYGGLRLYLFNLLVRIFDDERVRQELERSNPEEARRFGKTVVYDGEGRLCFCTGLWGRKSGFYIYGVCSDRDEDGRYHTIEWVENDYLRNGRDSRLPPDDGAGNYGLPYPAHWTREPEKLVCQYRKLGGMEARTALEHFIHDHADRFPKECYRNAAGALDFEMAKKRIMDAVYAARKKVQANYRYALPGYYRGKIILLLPLCLANSEDPDAYLVLCEGQDGNYFAPSLLTPSMAYYSARVVIPQETGAWERSFFAELKRASEASCRNV